MTRSILVVEDDADIREAVAEVLEQAGYEVQIAADGAQGLALLRAGARPHLILLDLMMPVMDGWDFRRAQRKDPALRDIPVVVVSSVADVREESALLEPADYMVKPVRAQALLDVVARLAGPATDEPQPLPRLRVLVVDDHVDVAATLAELLEVLGQDVHVAADGESALERAPALNPDLVLLDVRLPGIGGLEVARRMRTMTELAETALVILSGFGQAHDRRASRAAGAAAHLVKPIRAAKVEELLRCVAAKQPLERLES